MKEQAIRLKTTGLQLSRVIRALEDLHATVLPKDPGMYAILSQADLEMLARLCKELGELLDVEFDRRHASPPDEPVPLAAVEPISGTEFPSTSVAGKD